MKNIFFFITSVLTISSWINCYIQRHRDEARKKSTALKDDLVKGGAEDSLGSKVKAKMLFSILSHWKRWILKALRLGNLSKCQSNNETCFVDFRTCCTSARSTMKSYRRWTGWSRWCQKWWENLPMASVDPSFIFFLIKPVSSQAAQLGIQLIIQYVNFIVFLLKSNFLYISTLCFAVSEPHCQARAKWFQIKTWP